MDQRLAAHPVVILNAAKNPTVKNYFVHFFQGDRTELVTAPKGRRGCVTYLDFSSETISADPEPAPFNSTIEDEILVS